MRIEEFRENLLHMWPAKVLSIGAAILLYIFVALFGLERFDIMVPIQYKLPDGMVQATEYKQKANLVFRAPKSVIDELKKKNYTPGDFLVEVDLTKENGAGKYKAVPKISLLSGGMELRQFGFERSEPGFVEGTLEPAFEKEVIVFPILKGQPPSGYELGDYSVIPDRIIIEGPKIRLDKLGSLETEPVNLDSHDQTFITKARIQILDPLVRSKETNSVSVRINIRSSLEMAVYNNIPIEIIGIQDQLRVLNQVPLGTVRLRQPLDGSGNQQFRLIADVSTILSEGIATIPVLPLADTSVDILEIIPATISIELGKIPPVVEGSTP